MYSHMQMKISREHFRHCHYRNKRRIQNIYSQAPKSQTLSKHKAKQKQVLCSSPSLQTWDSNNLVIPQGRWSFCKQTQLQAVPMAEERRHFILRREDKHTHTHPPLPAPFPGRGPTVLVNNSIPGPQKPLEGVQSCMYMTWFFPISWYKPGYVLNT